SPLAADAKAATESEIVTPRPVSPKFEPGSVSAEIKPPKIAGGLSLSQSSSSPQLAGLISRKPSMPSAGGEPKAIADETKIAPTTPPASEVDANPGGAATPPQFNGLSREVDSASDATLEMAARDAPPADKFAIDRWASKHSGPFLIAFASALLA